MASDFFLLLSFFRRWMNTVVIFFSGSQREKLPDLERQVGKWMAIITGIIPVFSGWKKMKTGVASKQMNLMFIKQVCLGTEDEEVYGRAIPSLGMNWMPRTRETCEERKRYDCTSKSKRKKAEYSREQSSLHICELEAKKGTECVLFSFNKNPLPLCCKSSFVLTVSKSNASWWLSVVFSLWTTSLFDLWGTSSPKSENPWVYLAMRKSFCCFVNLLGIHRGAGLPPWSDPLLKRTCLELSLWKRGLYFQEFIQPFPLPSHRIRERLTAFNFLLLQPFHL